MIKSLIHRRQGIPKEQYKNGQSREKQVTQGTQDVEKQNKNTTQYVMDAAIRKQIKKNVNKT